MTNIEMFEIGDWCEVTTNDGYNWKAAKVLFVDELIVLIGEVEGKADRKLLRRCDADVSFRAYRTAEQIAAEDRKKEILQMIDVFGTDTAIWGLDAVREICGHLWEAGYRKQ